MRELVFELGDLCPQRSDGLDVLRDMAVNMQEVARYFGLDVLGLIRILECVMRLVIVRTRRAHTGNHNRLAVPAERKLEKTREFAVAVRNVPAASTAGARLAEGIDAAAQGQERAVDVGAFFHADALVGCRRSTLGSSQVDNVERRAVHFLDRVGCARAPHDIDLEDRMTSTAHRIRLRRTLCAPLIALCDHLQHLFGRLGYVLRDADDGHLAGGILPQCQATPRGCRRLGKQITNGLIVDLQVREAHIRFEIAALRLDPLIESLHRQKDEARVGGRATDGVCLTAPRRAVRKDTRIKAAQHA